MVKITILQAMAWLEKYIADPVARWDSLKELLIEQDTRAATLRTPVHAEQNVACEHEWLASTLPGISAFCTKCGAKSATF